jgi:hypothetical protein
MVFLSTGVCYGYYESSQERMPFIYSLQWWWWAYCSYHRHHLLQLAQNKDEGRGERGEKP